MWEDKIYEAMEESLRDEREFLKGLEDQIGAALQSLAALAAELPCDIGYEWVHLKVLIRKIHAHMRGLRLFFLFI